jgi:proteasome lid subunit RPN8/RPN11
MESCPQCGRDLDMEELGILPEAYELAEEEVPEAEVPKPTKPMIRKEIKREVMTAFSPEAAYFIYIPGKTNESEIKQYLDGYFKSRKTGREGTNDALQDVNIFISLNAAKKMLDHCYSKGREKEVMGLIIGETFEDKEKNKIFSVARDVATSDLDASEVDVRFQNFEKLFEHLEELDYDYQILGWYHSHPDYSSFMSPTDVDTNRRMFKLPYQYAVVIDPIRFDMKAFTHDRLRKKKAKELPFAIFSYDKYKKWSGPGAQQNGEALTANKPLIRNEVKHEIKELDTPPQRAYLNYLPGVTHDKDIRAYLEEFYNNKKIGKAVLTDGLGTEVTKFIEIGAARKMLDHCFKYRDSHEVMGLILGKRYQYKDRVLSIGRDVATSELEANAVNVRFESFEKLFHQLDNLKYEYQILGWYHSHPGHTCFMSDTDVDTQKRMFIHPYQFALVIDPVHFDVKGFTLDQRSKKNVKACGFAFIE